MYKIIETDGDPRLDRTETIESDKYPTKAEALKAARFRSSHGPNWYSVYAPDGECIAEFYRDSNKDDDSEDHDGEWVKASELPDAPGRYKVRAGQNIRFADFINGKWIGGIQFDAWHSDQIIHEPDDSLNPHEFQSFPSNFELVHESVFDPSVSTADEERLDFTSAVTLAQKELTSLSVEFVRVFTVNEDADSDTTGKVLATSERYAAQHVGQGDVVMHEMNRLDRKVTPGEEVTISYRNGLAQVYNQKAELRDVVVSGEGMNQAELRFIREELMNLADEDMSGKSDDDFQLMVDMATAKAAKQFGWLTQPGAVLVTQVNAIEEHQKNVMNAAALRSEQAYSEDFGFDPARLSDANKQVEKQHNHQVFRG